MNTPARYSVEIEAEAAADLRAMALYMDEHLAPGIADAFLTRILGRIDLLETFPLRGAHPKELEGINERDYRQIVSGDHRIFYRVVDQRVIVSLIVDGRRDLQPLLAARLLGR